MRRKDKEITDIQIIEDIFKRSEVCRLGIKDEPAPYVIPFNYGYENRNIYIHTSPQGKSIDLLQKNPTVSFEIELFSEIMKGNLSCQWTTRYRSLMGYGKVEFVEDLVKKQRALDLIMAHYGRAEGNTYQTGHVENLMILKITIENVNGKQSGDWRE